MYSIIVQLECPACSPIKSMETHNHVYLIVGSVTPFLTVPMCPKPNVEFTPSKRGCILALRDEEYT